MGSTLTAVTALGRLVGIVAMVLTASAVGLARLVPAAPPCRGRATATIGGINAASLYGAGQDGLVGVDAETGASLRRTLGVGECLDFAAASPWCDETGDVHVVGRWRRSIAGGWGRVHSREYGLALLRYPSGTILDRRPIRVLLSGPPCWDPCGGQEVIAPAWDGKLYRVTIESRAGETELTEPFAIGWAIPAPGDGAVFINDLCWPAGPRFRGKLVVSLLPRVRQGDRLVSRESQLWWLELDESREAIVAAGPLAPDAGRECRRCPVPVTLQDGRPGLAYLTLKTGTTYELRRSPIQFDPETGEPLLAIAEERTLADHCNEAGRISVSADGTKLTCFVGRRAESASPLSVFLGTSSRH